MAARRFESFWGRSIRTFLGRGVGPGEVEELTGAFFLRLYARGEAHDWRHPFKVYLRTMLLNLARAEQRRRTLASRPEQGPEDLEEHPGSGAAGPAPRVSLVERLRALVSFEMPAHVALVARRPGSPAASRKLSAAMVAYAAGRYAEAVPLLKAARRRGPVPEIDLYLGACHLEAGRAVEACRALRRLVRNRPRVGEYRWYLAQACLLAGKGAQAQEALEHAAALPGPCQQAARDLAPRLLAILGPPPRDIA